MNGAVNSSPSPSAAAQEPALAAPRQPIAGWLMKGTVVYALANFGVRALNFFLLPLYTRFLTPADYGTIALAEIVATVIIAVAALGSEGALSRLYFQYPEASREQREYISTVLRFSLTVVAAAVALALLLGPAAERGLASGFSVAFVPYIALALGTAGVGQATQYALALYRLRMRPRPYAVTTATLFALTLAATIPMVVLWPRGALGMLGGKLIAAVAVAVASATVLWPWLRGGWQWRFVRETLPLALPLMPHQLLALGLVVADRFIMERYRSLDEVGIYSVAYTCGMAMFLLTQSLMQAWGPMFYDVARAGDAGRPRLAQVSSVLAQGLTALAAAGALVAPAFTRLLDARYAAMASLIPLVIAAYLLHAFFSMAQLAILQSKRSHFILYASALALAANLGLNLLWIPRWGMFGAAYATIAGYGVEALAAYGFAQRVYRLRYRLGPIAAMLLLLALIVAATQTRSGGAAADLMLGLSAALPLGWLWLLWRRLRGSEPAGEAAG